LEVKVRIFSKIAANFLVYAPDIGTCEARGEIWTAGAPRPVR